MHPHENLILRATAHLDQVRAYVDRLDTIALLESADLDGVLDAVNRHEPDLVMREALCMEAAHGCSGVEE